MKNYGLSITTALCLLSSYGLPCILAVDLLKVMLTGKTCCVLIAQGFIV
jgi:hypothetical protein